MEHTLSESDYNMDHNRDILYLLKDLESRNFELRANHNTTYFTFIGFIITITAVFLGFNDNLEHYLTYIFLGSIIFFIFGFYLYFEVSAIGIKKMENIYEITAKAKDERTDPSVPLKDNLKKTCWERFAGKAYIYLQNLGLLFFVVGIILYVVG